MTVDPASTSADEQRKSRYRDILTGVFGLVLALGAFSITTNSFDSRAEVWGALGVYAPAFFFVLAIWQITGELFDRYPADDHLFYTIVTVVLFLTTLSPAFLNLLGDDAPGVRELSALLFPLSMGTVFGLLTLLWLRLDRLSRRRGLGPLPDIRENVIATGSLALIFLVSLLLPDDGRGTSPRTLAWFAAFVAPDAILWLHRRLGR